MNNFLIQNYQAIIFDFDGVIQDSVKVKTLAFQEIFRNYPQKLVDLLITYHIKNGGISRYEKIRYFYEKILNQEISQIQIEEYAKNFSQITKPKLLQKISIIEETLSFIQTNFKNYKMFIASGADEKDLLEICNTLDLNKYFLQISGSPKKKSLIVKEILSNHKLDKNKTILIGDSINDYLSAKENLIHFAGYNNLDLINIDDFYIDSFKLL